MIGWIFVQVVDLNSFPAFSTYAASIIRVKKDVCGCFCWDLRAVFGHKVRDCLESGSLSGRSKRHPTRPQGARRLRRTRGGYVARRRATENAVGGLFQRPLGSHLPTRQILLLFLRQLVDLHPHAREFQPRNLLINHRRHWVHLLLQFLIILVNVFG